MSKRPDSFNDEVAIAFGDLRMVVNALIGSLDFEPTQGELVEGFKRYLDDPAFFTRLAIEGRMAEIAPSYRPDGQNHDSFVYLMRCPRTKRCKIGISTNPEARRLSFRTAVPGIQLLGFVKADKEIEAMIHHKFRSENDGGEWFKLSEEQIIWIREQVFHQHSKKTAA